MVCGLWFVVTVYCLLLSGLCLCLCLCLLVVFGSRVEREKVES